MGWPFNHPQAHGSQVRVEEVHSGAEHRQGRLNEQPRVEEPDDDGNFPQTMPHRPPHPHCHPPPRQHPRHSLDPFSARPGFHGDPFGSHAPFGSSQGFGGRSPFAMHDPFAGHSPFGGGDPFADFGFGGSSGMMARMKADMDRMRADMRSTLAEARAHSAPSGATPFSYTCTKWTSVDHGQGGPKIEHRVAAYGSSDLGHHLKETVRDGRTGETRVLREESRPVGYRHKDHQRRQQAITNE